MAGALRDVTEDGFDAGNNMWQMALEGQWPVLNFLTGISWFNCCNRGNCWPGTSPRNLRFSFKRHCSQQLGRAAKDSHMIATQNKYGLLNNAVSYPDRSMKPASIISTPGTSKLNPGQSFASKVGSSSRSTQNPQLAVKPDSLPLLEAGGLFSINNEGTLREELEVEFSTIDGEKFHGTVSHH
jgi:hypothetical protein